MTGYAHHDLHLLFGLLALQNDFVSREELITATSVWLQDKSQSLADILLRRGMPRDVHDLVRALTDKHLEQHGGDPERSLAALSSIGGVRDELTRLGDAQLDAMLACVSRSSSAESALCETTSFEAGRTRSGGERFRILRPHAKGGLGEVFVARDVELGREVALKEIQQRFADHPVSRTRFVQEAEITGALEHPGIVPVYGLGQYQDGRPFYAMRFIKGNSLREAIEAFHADPTKSWSSGESLLKLRELLGRFIDVCQAVEYAHSRGVLHRDLKPGNIMLGKYGETLVVDWGLAKAIGRDGVDLDSVSDESTIRPSSGSGSSATEMGQVIGTAAYMSPEQASGRLDQIGRASDVYSLGATLYCLLSGRAPFTDKDVEAILPKVREGNFPPPRKVNPRIPRSLESICLRAMSTRSQDRYESPSGLVRDIERWLADESVTAHRETLGERLTRLSRRYKTAVRAAVIGLSAVAIVATSAALLINQQKNRAEKLAFEKAELAEANGRIATSERNAKEESQRAGERTQRVLDYLVSAFRKPDPSVDGRKVTVASVLKQALRDLDSQLAADPLEKATLLNAIGQSFHGLGLDSFAIEACEQAVVIRREKLGEDHLETITSTILLAACYQRNGELDKALPLCEKTLELATVKLGKDHPHTLASMNNLATAHLHAGRLDKALPLLKQTLELTQPKLGKDHLETLTLMNNLASGYESVGKLREAIPLREETLGLLRSKVGEDHPRTLLAMNNLASAYDLAGQSDKALPILERTLELMRGKLAENHPDTLLSMNNLAKAYRSTGQLRKALPLWEKVLGLRRASLGEAHPQTLVSMNDLASAYRSDDQLDKALPLCERTLELMRAKLGADHPYTLTAMNNLATTYESAKQLGPALSLYEKTLELTRAKQGENHPDTLTSMDNLAGGYYATGQLKKALELWETTLELSRANQGEDHPETLITMNSLALAYQSAGQFEKALSLLERTLEHRRAKLGEDHSDSRVSMRWLNGAYLETRQFAKAEQIIRQWLAALDRLDSSAATEVARAKTALAESLLGQEQLDAALDQVKSALEITTDDRSNSVLGGILAKQAKWNDAEPLLLDSYQKLEQQLPTTRGHQRWHVPRACERIIGLYEAQSRTDEVAKWQGELAAVQLEIERLRGPNVRSEANSEASQRR